MIVKLGIMQPYFFPYIGYFQLMNAVDEFVVYDNIEFTKKGWINRNRILVNGKDSFITIPIKKDSDYLDIRDRYLAETWRSEKNKMLNRIIESYRKAPEFNSVFSLIEKCILNEESNLFNFILHSLKLTKDNLGIKSTIVISSTIPIDNELKSENKVIEICKARGASSYINPIGGTTLYQKERFETEGIRLDFIKTDNISYKQFNNEFVPWLSIIDVMMFNPIEQVKNYLDSCYTLT